jgi:hypothetical protein
VIAVLCRPELNSDDLDRAVRISAPPFFVFGEFHRLSDEQIERICEGPLRREGNGAAVLLTPSSFLSRLERPALQFLKQRISAQFRFRELGHDEAIAFLHHQLLARQHHPLEARAFRRGVLVGLGVGGIAMAASLGAILLNPSTQQVCEPAGIPKTSSVSAGLAMLRPVEEAMPVTPPIEAGPNLPARPLAATAPSPPIKVEDRAPAMLSPPWPVKIEDSAPAELSAVAPGPPPLQEKEPDLRMATQRLSGEIEQRPATAAATTAPASAGPRRSDTEIAALLARGDAFLGAGDITSARLFYERAADAESGLAALRLGRTFDPAYPVRAGLHAAADPAQALLWYRRARELGAGEAEQRIKALEAYLPANSSRAR